MGGVGKNAPTSVTVITSPVENGKSSGWAPSKSYKAVAVPSPLGAGGEGAAGIGLEAAGATGGGAEEAECEGAAAAAAAEWAEEEGEAEKRLANCGRAAKYSSRRAKKASFSAESCSMAVKTPPPAPAPAAAAVLGDARWFRGGGAGGAAAAAGVKEEEAFRIGGGGGLEFKVGVWVPVAAAEGVCRPGDAAPEAALPARGLW